MNYEKAGILYDISTVTWQKTFKNLRFSYELCLFN